LIKEAGIDYVNLPDEKFDSPLGESGGAATIFGVTGGVMEAALRSAYFYLTGKDLENVEFAAVRGLEGIKEAVIPVNGLDIKVAVAHSLVHARKLMEDVRDGKSPYHFIEIMACPGGCIGGGGQPIPTDLEIRKKRGQALYKEDRDLSYRQSHHNPSVIKVYEEFLKEPNGHLAHELLHTHYSERVYPIKED
jgi:iron only hydrogenase large subunit-like protein